MLTCARLSFVPNEEPRGKPQGSRTGGVRHMFGAYDMERDRLLGIFATQKNWITFLAFLKWLLNAT